MLCIIGVWEQAAYTESYACLSSRFPYGETTTKEKPGKMAIAEFELRKPGFSPFKIGYQENTARLEFIGTEMDEAWIARDRIKKQAQPFLIGRNTYFYTGLTPCLMLSMKTRYAMLALVYLAKKYNQGYVKAQEIAESENIPVRFLESILLEVKKMGLISSKSGKNGGYFLIKPPGDIKLLDLIRNFEGGIGLLYCVSENHYQPCEFCKDEATCKIRYVFKEVRESTINILQRTTLDNLK